MDVTGKLTYPVARVLRGPFWNKAALCMVMNSLSWMGLDFDTQGSSRPPLYATVAIDCIIGGKVFSLAAWSLGGRIDPVGFVWARLFKNFNMTLNVMTNTVTRISSDHPIAPLAMITSKKTGQMEAKKSRTLTKKEVMQIYETGWEANVKQIAIDLVRSAVTTRTGNLLRSLVKEGAFHTVLKCFLEKEQVKVSIDQLLDFGLAQPEVRMWMEENMMEWDETVEKRSAAPVRGLIEAGTGEKAQETATPGKRTGKGTAGLVRMDRLLPGQRRMF